MIVFISDIHLSTSYYDNYFLFMKFLSEMEQRDDVKKLYILGDLFNFWIGDDELDKSYEIIPIINIIKNIISSGVEIYFQKGNREPFLGDKFFKKTNIKKMNPVEVININGNNIVLAHGHELCIDDKKFMYSWKFLKSPVARVIFSLIPYKIRRKISLSVRDKTQSHRDNKNLKMNNTSVELPKRALEGVLVSNHSNILIHGHTHKAILKSIGDNYLCYSLGEWLDSAYYLSMDEQGSIRWNFIKLDKVSSK